MKKVCTIFLCHVFLLGLWPIYSNIILNAGGFFHWNNKTIEARDLKGNTLSTLNENYFYPGLSTGLEFPFIPNTIALSTNINVVWSKQELVLNQYNIGNYEYYYVQADGERRNTINTCIYQSIIQNCVNGRTGQTYGNLTDFNLQQKIESTMKQTGKNYVVEASDIVIISNILLKYNTPVYLPWKGKAFEIMSLVLRTINPYFGAGISTIMVNRKLTLNPDIKSSLDTENGFSILPACTTDPCETIEGEDPAPDPDFYLTVGAGLNIAHPIMKILGIQSVVTIEFLYHWGLSPDDTNKTFDDNYNYTQRGYSIRVASGILL